MYVYVHTYTVGTCVHHTYLIVPSSIFYFSIYIRHVCLSGWYLLHSALSLLSLYTYLFIDSMRILIGIYEYMHISSTVVRTYIYLYSIDRPYSVSMGA